MPSLSSGSLTIDRVVRGVGRIHIRSGTRDPQVFARMNNAITELLHAGDLPALRDLRAGRIRAADLCHNADGPVIRRLPSFRLYAFRATQSGFIKFGITGDVPRRLTVIRSANWEEIELLAHAPSDRRTEAILHTQLAPWRIRGEWYEPADRVLAEVERLRGAAR